MTILAFALGYFETSKINHYTGNFVIQIFDTALFGYSYICGN